MESAAKTAELIPQPHGGALLTAGVPGNRGGGRPPSVVREAAREAFHVRIPILAKLADDETISPAERISAIDKLGKHGLSGHVSWDDIRERLGKQLAVIQALVPPEHHEALLAQLADVWR